MTESLKQRLQSALNVKSNANNKMSKLEEDELFKKEYLTMKGQTLHTEHQSYKVIPQFYSSLPTEQDALQQKLREEARAQFLQRRSKVRGKNILKGETRRSILCSDCMTEYVLL